MNIHGDPSFLLNSPPLIVRFFLFWILVVLALLCIQQVGKVMRRRHRGFPSP